MTDKPLPFSLGSAEAEQLQASCVRTPTNEIPVGQPHAQAIHLSLVWHCDSPGQADQLLGNPGTGYVYRRDGHPNATSLANQLGQLHGADRTILTAQGMSALSLAFLSQLKPGDHVVLSRQLYGKTNRLVGHEMQRWGITSQQVDVNDHAQLRAACNHPKFRMLVAETLANPCLDVADIEQLAEVAHSRNGLLLIDNTFATPLLCRPLDWKADLVMESLSKFVCGHGDVMLGQLSGKAEVWGNTDSICSTWGFASSPLDCWLTQRGLATLPIRLKAACENALSLASFLSEHPLIERVYYPGLTDHPEHALAKKQFGSHFGHMLSFRPRASENIGARLIAALKETVPFCPSLGECQTTLSHPASTSHRSLSPEEKKLLDIDEALLRISCGIEPTDWLVHQFRDCLRKIG